MERKDRVALYGMVRRWVRQGPWADREYVLECIRHAHNGRPDGCLVTNDNMWMLRQYRNGVSADPEQLVSESLACREGE